MFEKSLSSITKRVVDGGARLDGWVNQVFGFGTGRDPTEAGHFCDQWRIPDVELSALFHQSDIARKIVVVPPREMLRQGVEFQTTDLNQKANIVARFTYLDALNQYYLGWIWGRLFGGAVIFVGADDGRPANTPLLFDQVRSVKFLQIYDRRYLSIVRRYQNPAHPKFREPEIYRITSIWGTVSEVHESRLEVFRGALTDEEQRERLDTWDYSTLQNCYAAMRQFDTAFKAGELMLRDASQGVFKMKGLMSMIAGGRIADIQTRAQMLDMTRSVARSLFLDSDGDESFEKIATQFASVDQMLDRFCNRISAASEIPVTLLMGQAPAGLNATGESDLRVFYDTIKTTQTNDAKPRFERLARLIAKAQGSDPSLISVNFPPLWQETPEEKADRRLKVAQADLIYLTNDVVTPEEMAKNRFGGEDYSDETKIDLRLRLGQFLPAKAPPPAAPPGSTSVEQPAKAPPPPSK